MTLSLIVMLTPNFSFLGFLFDGYKQINLYLQNSQSKTKVLRVRVKSQLRFGMMFLYAACTQSNRNVLFMHP